MKGSLKSKKQKNKRIHALVSGKVQGVFFRDNTVIKARKENLIGWVKNLKNGEVEIEAEGDLVSLEKFIQFLWEGPTNARVENVFIEDTPLKKEKNFIIK